MSRDVNRYCLVYQEGEGSPVVSEPQPLPQVLAAFAARIAAGGFGPGQRRRLRVVRDEPSSAAA